MARIPDTYQEVEYLRGTGTQYIRTSYFATGNTSIKIKFRVNELQGFGIFGSRDTTTPTNAFLMWGAGAGFWRAQYGNQNFVSEIERDTEWHTWEQRKNACFLDGKWFYTFEKQTFQNSYEQLLFGIGSNATTITGLYIAKDDIGVVEYWENNELTMQLIPCYRKSDKTAGYYDTVLHEFLTNAGTGKFEVGKDIIYPEEIQEVEYLESTGTQYIDTGIIGKTGEYKIRTKVRTSDNISGLQSIYGVRTDSSNTRFMLGFYTSSNQIKFDFAINTDNFGQVVAKDTDYEFEADYTTATRTLKIDGSSNITSTASLDTGGNIYIFGYNRMWQPVSQMTSFFVGRMYNFEIIDKNGKSILSLKPAYRKSDNKTGMYDRKRKVFFPNLGSGEFLLGENVYRKDLRMIYWQGKLPAEYQELEYIKSSGTQYILTDFMPTKTTNWEIKLSSTSQATNWAMGSPTWVGVHYKKTEVGITNSASASGQKYAQYNYDDAPITLKLQDNSVYADGNLLGTITRYNGTQAFSIFGYRGGNAATLLFTGKIYYVKLYNEQVLTNYFIPCFRKSDNVVGMYDTVVGKFYTNSGTGTFIKGSYASLPSEYQAVEYVESAGASTDTANTHSIDLGFKGNQDVVMNCRVAILNSPRRVFGDNTTASKAITLYLASSGTEINRFGSNQVTGAIPSTLKMGNFQNYRVDKNGIFCDGQQIATYSPVTFETDGNLRFLTIGGYPPNVGVLRVKDFEIVGKVKLVACKRKTDNVAGFYDFISGEFKTCAGLTAGDNIFYYKPEVRFIYTEASNPFVPGVSIPNEYQEVEYIESDGNQYINTGYTGNIDTEVNYHGKFLSAAGTFFQIFGNNVTSSRALTVNLNITGNAATSRFGNKTASMSYRVPADTEVRLKLNRNVFGYVDNKGYLQSSPIDATTAFTTNGTLYLMFVNGGSYKGASKFYEATIVQAGAVVRKYKPVYRKADGVIGVYDVITGTFLTNAGTGTFKKGADVKNRTVRFIYM